MRGHEETSDVSIPSSSFFGSPPLSFFSSSSFFLFLSLSVATPWAGGSKRVSHREFPRRRVPASDAMHPGSGN